MGSGIAEECVGSCGVGQKGGGGVVGAEKRNEYSRNMLHCTKTSKKKLEHYSRDYCSDKEISRIHLQLVNYF